MSSIEAAKSIDFYQWIFCSIKNTFCNSKFFRFLIKQSYLSKAQIYSFLKPINIILVLNNIKYNNNRGRSRMIKRLRINVLSVARKINVGQPEITGKNENPVLGSETGSPFGAPNTDPDSIFMKMMILQVGILFVEYHKKYFNRRIWFPVKPPSEKNTKQVAQIRKLIENCITHGVEIDLFMKSQFESLAPWMIKRGCNFLVFGNFLSDKAFPRYEEWLEKADKKFFLPSVSEAEMRVPVIQLFREAMEAAMDILSERLSRVYAQDELTEEIIRAELEMLIHTRAISPITLIGNPMVEGSKYLQTIEVEQRKLFTFSELKRIMALNDELQVGKNIDGITK